MPIKYRANQTIYEVQCNNNEMSYQEINTAVSETGRFDVVYLKKTSNRQAPDKDGNIIGRGTYYLARLDVDHVIAQIDDPIIFGQSESHGLRNIPKRAVLKIASVERTKPSQVLVEL